MLRRMAIFGDHGVCAFKGTVSHFLCISLGSAENKTFAVCAKDDFGQQVHVPYYFFESCANKRRVVVK